MDADALLDRRRLKRRLTLWRLAALAAVAAAVLAVAGRVGGEGGLATSHVARVKVEGLITDDPQRVAAISKLADNDRVQAVIVRIDSPGGTAVGGEALFRALRTVAAKKPVVATIGTLGASGGYMTALGADRIYVRETSLTGSIGVILEAPEMSRLLDTIGVSITTVKSGPLKGEPSIDAPPSPAARAALQSVIDDSFSYFKGLVRDRRGLDGPALDKVTDGRVFTGRQAVAANLADAIGGEAEARAWLAESKGVSADLPVRDVRVPGPGDWLPPEIAGAARKILLGEWLNLDGLMTVWHPAD